MRRRRSYSASGPRWWLLPADEEVDLVDEEDTVVGAATLRNCLEKGLLHRAVAVLVLRTNGKVLLQQRSKRDLWHPGLWTLSCTGHVKSGEKYRDAAKRELDEELGLRSPLRAFTKLLLPPFTSRGLTEWEWVSLFVSKTDRTATTDPIELESVEDVSVPRLRRILPGPRLTPDAKVVLRVFLKSGSRRPGPRRLRSS
ncbi:MAG: NUDIX domain-containing protein [Nitrososphaerales archaeon]|jgi:isopentenyl-diphosphate delta-isomerase type 1